MNPLQSLINPKSQDIQRVCDIVTVGMLLEVLDARCCPMLSKLTRVWLSLPVKGGRSMIVCITQKAQADDPAALALASSSKKCFGSSPQSVLTFAPKLALYCVPLSKGQCLQNVADKFAF